MVKYLLSVISAAIISSVITNAFEKNSTFRGIGRLLVGIFLAITVISPLVKLDIPDIDEYKNMIENDCGGLVEEGKEFYQNEKRAIITEQIESYISDKASAVGTDLNVTVQLSESEPPVPEMIELNGAASPYARRIVENIITQDLGVPKERLKWK